MTREEIIDVIIDLYEQLEISDLGFDLIKIVRQMEINLIPYSCFDEKNQLSLIKYDEDGFNLINPKNNKVEIYYNDKIIPYKRIKFTIPHELGHICLGHNSKLENESYEHKKEADLFANEFYCPQAFMIYYNLRTKSDLMSAFDITERYASILIEKFNKRKNMSLSHNERRLIEVFLKNIKKKS